MRYFGRLLPAIAAVFTSVTVALGAETDGGSAQRPNIILFVAAELRRHARDTAGPGQGGGVVGDLGDLLRRVRMPDDRPSLNDPRALAGVLHVYAIGYRNYMLYGVERWIGFEENLPAFREKINALESEAARLRREKPHGWLDSWGRYEDAIEGLKELIVRIDTAKR